MNLALEKGGGYSGIPKALKERKEFNFARIHSLYKLKSFYPKIFEKEPEKKLGFNLEGSSKKRRIQQSEKKENKINC